MDHLALTCRYEEGLALADRTAIAPIHLVPKEHFILIGGTAPCLKECQVGRSGTYQVEDLLSLRGTIQNKFPH